MLSEFPDVDIRWMVTGVEAPAATATEVEIPVVEEITAGELTLFVDAQIVGKTVTTNTRDKDLFGLKVKGDSMFPELQEGDIAICAPHKPFTSGKIYAVQCNGGETTIKRVFKRREGYELSPSNPEYDPMTISDQDMCRLIRVIEVQRFV